jgi:hypothetical protein
VEILTSSLTKVAMFNEIVIHVILLHLYLFTDFIPGAKTRSIMGLSMSFFILLAVLTNLGKLVYGIVKDIINKVKGCKKQNKAQKAPINIIVKSKTDETVLP